MRDMRAHTPYATRDMQAHAICDRRISRIARDASMRQTHASMRQMLACDRACEHATDAISRDMPYATDAYCAICEHTRCASTFRSACLFARISRDINPKDLGPLSDSYKSQISPPPVCSPKDGRAPWACALIPLARGDPLTKMHEDMAKMSANLPPGNVCVCI
jgi:hypothetical protein